MKIRAASSGGSPTATSTMTSVKSPAWGTPAAPMLAAVAVMLRVEGERREKQLQVHVADILTLSCAHIVQ